ncbi:MAG: hypothetical protein P8J87_11655 [Verrucomicrobiales bacterium]|nr:hypothetical protein [Verrucomicrobiales bacterium]
MDSAWSRDSNSALAACFGMWRYDVGRLRVYSGRREELPIKVLESESLLALRFDDVGYFNRAIGSLEAIESRQRELIEFYGGGVLPFRFSLRPGEDGRDLLGDGFVKGEVEEYLVRKTCMLEREMSEDWGFEPLDGGEAEAFFSMYLRLFSGGNCQREEGLRNMVHLAELEGLRCCWSLYKGERVGLGMWQRQGNLACFCAGAILPAFRGQGGHDELLRHRLDEARNGGCKFAVAVAKEGSDSAKNLRRAGFQLVWRDEALYWPGAPEGGSGI